MLHKNEWLISFCLLIGTGTQVLAQQSNQEPQYKIGNIKDKGQLAPKANFTGTVWVNMAVQPGDQLNSTVGKVTFSPKARTNWHIHPYGQILIVTAGIGYYQEKGKERQVIREGDVVKIPANTLHWHGASHQKEMTHLAIVPSDKNGTIWNTPVTNEDYNATDSTMAL